MELQKYKSWLLFLEDVKSFFKSKKYLEVYTPTLVASGAMEASLEAFKIKGESFYLPTSPEFSLKKLWLKGLSPKLFEVAKSFRKEEVGKIHLQEFHMLEFYLANENLDRLIEESFDFFCHFINAKQIKISLPEAFHTFTGFKLSPSSDEGFLAQVLKFHNRKFNEDLSWQDRFHLIYLDLIEPYFCKSSLVALTDYPPQLSALAKINPKGWSSRVEFLYGGVELGNGYDELLDAKECLLRWDKENQIRERESKEPHPVDDKLIKSIKNSHLTQGVGMAIGLERLFHVSSSFSEEGFEEGIKIFDF